jgi:hypothetical protein
MVTRVDVANMALALMDEAPITSLEYNNKAARLCNLHFETTREAELMAHSWVFAIFTVDVTGTSTGGDSGTFNWQYELPVDALRVLPPTYDNEAYGVPISWEIKNGRLYTDQETPRGLRYIGNLTDPDDWNALFTEVVAAALAAKVALALTHKTSMLQIAQNAYDRALARAMAVNAVERRSRLYDASWARQRGDTRHWRA